MYNTLSKLPIVIYEEISETGNFSLLLHEGEEAENDFLADLWQKLSLEFSDKNESSDSKRNMRISKEIAGYECKHKTISLFLECLKYDWNNELVAKLREWGYRVEQATYFDDLERIEREMEGLLLKIANLESMLPKQDGTVKKSSIYDVLASYSAILGIDFNDYDMISCLKYLSLQKQVASKIKSSEQNTSSPKNNTKRKR